MKKFISVMLVAAMAVTALTGCGSNSGSSSKKDADKYYIGGIGPTTGATAIYGTAVKNGAQIAVDEINAAGGINGKQIEYRFEDDQNDAEKAVNAYNTLKDWGMQMLVGTTTTAPCIAVAGKTASDNVFQITPSASSPDVLSSGNGNVFQVCFTDPNQGVASAQYIAENKLATKIGIIYDSSDVYSSGIEEKFEAEAKTQGLNIVSKAAFTADSKTDFGTQLQKAKDAGADLLFLPIYYQEASIILKQADTMGYKPKFFGVDGMDGILTVENFDTKLAEDVMLLTPFAADAKDKTVQNFVKTYKEKYKDTPNQFAADSYDAVYALKAAIEESKATTDMSASDMCDALKGAMTKIKMQGLTGGEDGLTWNESGEVTKSPKAVIIKNGAYKAM
ncbi:MAG: ABC transporter substrate-binding protein [Anaerobutyricum hallii]|jgi:branched-chain amino acid transport system substrate-binding protein|uniref:ABC transporter substrate-binding protein n=1 Tax=Anaerobutyricum hallii TaxID=39488 RepID=UPI00243247CD|nr:ABC transporter substrate-binding protein [Anaerobutyricum hallii]MDD6589897.1 ABC transporter substrate-binding protein [Anaerobutyricum hallii]MDY4577309.1 ABC transporter substrate-binding protein [Anaerobutyricum hallii]